MIVHDFNQEWTFEAADRPAVEVSLPHDAMILERRDRAAANLANTGWFPGGRYSYRKTFPAPVEWAGQHVSLLFEGAHHRSTVSLNGALVGGRPGGPGRERTFRRR